MRISLREMMFAAVPVVATPVGEVPEVVGERGTLAASVDATHLAAAIRAALVDLDVAKQRAAAARSVVMEKYGQERWLERIDKVYEAALSKRGIDCGFLRRTG